MSINHAWKNNSINVQMEEFNDIDSWDIDSIIEWIDFVRTRENFLVQDWLNRDQIIEAFAAKWYSFQDKELPISEKVINTFLWALGQGEYSIRDYIAIVITDWLAIDKQIRNLGFLDIEKDIAASMAWLNNFLDSDFSLDHHIISKIKKIFQDQGFDFMKNEPLSLKMNDIKRYLGEFMEMLKIQLKIQEDRRKFAERTEALVRHHEG